MDQMARALTYVEASNDHDLEVVEAMIADDAVYISTGVGSHEGGPAIRAMMNGFFASVSNLNWATSNWHVDEDGACAFDFTMTGFQNQTGERINKTGHERIWVAADGLITRIEVRVRC